MSIDDEVLVAGQIAYYRARAPEYDRVYAERTDLRALLATVDDLPITGDVLEPAHGTGQWTRALAARARSFTAVDASPEVLEIARGRAGFPNVLAAVGWSEEVRSRGGFVVGVAQVPVAQAPVAPDSGPADGVGGLK